MINLSVTADWIRKINPNEEFSLNHLREEICCCRACNGSYSRLWFEAAGACPEGLVRKQIIDRLGRKQNRCVRRDEASGEDQSREEILDVSSNRIREIISKSSGEHRNKFVTSVFGKVPEGFDFDDPNQWNDFVKDQKSEMGAVSGESVELKTIANSWGRTSVGGDANEIHQAMVHLFGDSDDRYIESLKKIDEHMPDTRKGSLPTKDIFSRDVIRTANQLTESMKIERKYWEDKLGPDGTLTLFRGMTLPKESVDLGDNVVQDLPASSWSMDARTAASFGTTIIKREVKPSEIIMSVFSQLSDPKEGEFVIYTSDEGAEVEVLTTR
jgi:hypothetical protein